MLSLIPLFAVSLLLAYALAVVKLMTAAWDAPVGYEDEEGFHFGLAVPTPRPVAVRTER